MLRLVKHLVVALVVIVFVGCSGGGCSSGCSCGGITPLPEGFDPEKRIENVAAVRVTDSGLVFLGDNVGQLASLLLGAESGGGIIEFEIPTSNGHLGCFVLGDANYSLCPDGPNSGADPKECTAEIDIGNSDLTITSAPNHNLLISGILPVRVQKLPVELSVDLCSPIPFNCSLCTGITSFGVDGVLAGNEHCPDDQPQTFHNVVLNVNVSIEIDTNMAHSRYGYSRTRVSISIDPDNIIDGLELCTGSSIGDDIINALVDLLAGNFVSGIGDTLNSAIEEQLCQKANPMLTPSCPTGTQDVNGICRFGATEAAECASIVLGFDGHIDLEGLLASFSPGTKGAFDMLLAGGGHTVRSDASGFHWGDLNPINQGATLGFYGGWEPTPVSGCVTPVDMPLPTGIPIPDELTLNTVPGWPGTVEGPHIGLALSERFTNYLFTQAYNSGALCLGLTADSLGAGIPLTSALVGAGLGALSMSELARQKQPAPLAILLRPAAPPSVEFGNGTDIATDPLLHIALPQITFDFYVWSLDRYVRAMSATMDLDIPMNLEVTPDGLVPVIESLGVSNSVVTNSGLIREDPAQLAAALQDLLGSLVGGFLGDALPPVDLNGQLADLGLGLDIPPTVDGQGSPGLRKLTKDTDDFLGIFAGLKLAASTANAVEEQSTVTTAEAVAVDIDPAGLSIATRTPENGPRVTLQLGSSLDDGTRAVEWQYKLDNAPWHPFTRERRIEVADAGLRLIGRHTVYVRSRAVGDVMSLDRQPAEVVVNVDGSPPDLAVHQDEQGLVHVQAIDGVSKTVEVRMRLGTADDKDILAWGTWSEWMPVSRLAAFDPGDAGFVDLEGRDEEGNVGTVTQPLIRGRINGASCQCTLPGGESRGGGSAALALLLCGLIVAWRRRRSTDRPTTQNFAAGGRAVKHAGAALGLVLLAGMSGCSCGDDVSEPVDYGCRARGDCQVLLPGLVGSYTSAAVASDGTIWLAGYLEGAWAGQVIDEPWAGDYSYGDLVVGQWDAEVGEVDWVVVDGIPADAVQDPQTYDPQGFRNGIPDPGPDVGLWTALALDDAGNPTVAYYDASNHALKFASLSDGAWQSATVQQAANSDMGRYAELIYENGLPTIAYLFLQPSDNGTIASGVRIARGSSSAATTATWTFEDAISDAATPCRGYLCATGSACVIETYTCVEQSKDCPEKCGDGQECVLQGGTAVCQDALGTSLVESYPDAVGLYISLDKKPNGALGMVFYDRIRGNLVAASNDGGMWTSLVVDGESGGVDTGDMGIGASLDIDQNGDYHVAYVNGLDESVNYMLVQGGTTPTAAELVDDGLVAGEGHHIIGDDSDILFTQGGEVHIAYQDATSGQLRYAVGAGQPRTWSMSPVQQADFAGAFSVMLTVEGTPQVFNFWRRAAPWSQGNVRLVRR